MQPEEQVQLSLPLSASAIDQAVAAFKQQFQANCYLYIRGQLVLSTGERCRAAGLLPVVRPDKKLDLIGIGDPDISDADELLTWVAATPTAILLLSTHKLDAEQTRGQP